MTYTSRRQFLQTATAVAVTAPLVLPGEPVMGIELPVPVWPKNTKHSTAGCLGLMDAGLRAATLARFDSCRDVLT